MRRLAIPLLGLSVVGAVLALYRPALSFELMGDDFQWVQHAHRAMHRPLLLLADLDTFYRPASTWTLVADRLAWRHDPAGFHLPNLLLHGLAGALLLLAARRLGLPPAAAGAVALLWAASPLADEPAISVAIRFEDLLFLAWLGLFLSWPRPGERWTRGRALAAGACTFLALMSKETWVVTPGLVAALELPRRDWRWRPALRASAPFLGLAAVYAAAYFAAFPGGKHYYEFTAAPLAKLPHEAAAFFGLEELVPAAFPVTWKGALASLVVVALAAFAIRRRLAAGVAGLALLLLPTVPTLLVPYLPTRYTAIPYAGFLLLTAAALLEWSGARSPLVRGVARGAALALAGVVLGVGAMTVRADLGDIARVSAAHARLLAEARAVAGRFPLDRPVLIVRDESDNPLREVAGSTRGLLKLFFVRHDDPDGLIDAGALFDWVIGREDVLVHRVDGGEDRVRGVGGAILLHRSDSFVWLSRNVEDVGGAMSSFSRRGLRVRLVVADAL